MRHDVHRSRLLCLLVLSVFLSCTGGSVDSEHLESEDINAALELLETSTHGTDITAETIVNRFNGDPIAIFEWTRDRIWFQAYRGPMRGAEGTLLAKAGNSWDQAILLKRLLDVAGIQNVILRGMLPDARATQLLDSMQPVQENQVVSVSRGALSDAGVQQQDFQAALKMHTAAVEALLGDISESAAGFASAMEQMADGVISRRALVDQTRDYAWIEATVNGTQVNMHPAFPRNDFPQLIPEGVLNYTTSIPHELWHWVRLQATVERITEGEPVREQILTTLILPASATGNVIRFSLRPVMQGESRVELNPVVIVGDTFFDGNHLVVNLADGALPGTLRTIWLEIAVLSPTERVRQRTVTLATADATRSLSMEDYSVTADLHLPVGSIAPARYHRAFADLIVRWQRLTNRQEEPQRDNLSGLLPFNPVLLHWSMKIDDVWNRVAPGAYLNAPAVLATIYRPQSANMVTSEGGILMLRAAGLAGEDADAAGAAASLLLLHLATAHDAAETGTYQLPQAYAPDFDIAELSNWDGKSRAEMLDDRKRKITLRVPLNAVNQHWWAAGSGELPVLRGPSGWMYRSSLEGAMNLSDVAGPLQLVFNGEQTPDALTRKKLKEALLNLLERHGRTALVAPTDPVFSVLAR